MTKKDPIKEINRLVASIEWTQMMILPYISKEFKKENNEKN